MFEELSEMLTRQQIRRMSGISNSSKRRIFLISEAKSKIEEGNRVVLNVSGELFETTVKTLLRFPDTLLGDRERRMNFYCVSNKEYKLNRCKLFFDAILFFYQSDGLLRCPDGIPLEMFEEECRFFDLPETFISIMKCRALKIAYNDEASSMSLSTVPSLPSMSSFDLNSRLITVSTPLIIRLHNILENPESSTKARYYGIISMTMIFLYLIVITCKTVRVLRADTNIFVNNWWLVAELVLNTWFLTELILGFLCTPNKCNFFSSIVKWCDMISTFTYFISFIINNKIITIGFLRVIRCFDLFRLFPASAKMAKLKKIVEIMKSTGEDLKYLMFCLGIALILGGSLMYYMEMSDKKSKFISIPEGIWWSVVTITTVGYGDIAPITSTGKLFGCCYMIFGVLVLSLPVLSVINRITALSEYKGYNEDSE